LPQKEKIEMSTLKEKGMYKRTFAEFLAKKHPEIKLQEWQIKVLNILLNQPIAAGKTLLIKLLAEYDMYAG
jgi:hypothetical protein